MANKNIPIGPIINLLSTGAGIVGSIVKDKKAKKALEATANIGEAAADLVPAEVGKGGKFSISSNRLLNVGVTGATVTVVMQDILANGINQANGIVLAAALAYSLGMAFIKAWGERG